LSLATYFCRIIHLSCQDGFKIINKQTNELAKGKKIEMLSESLAIQAPVEEVEEATGTMAGSTLLDLSLAS
jgi:hypothetical protein